MLQSLDFLQKEIGHSFKNSDLLRLAVTHSSTGKGHNYERLEFLGDRVLGLAVAEILYEKFPDEAEGDMAKRLAALVEGSLLAQVARTMELGDHIDFSDAERAAGGGDNDNILADVVESLIGALYLDGGFEPCRALIDKHWSAYVFEKKAPPQHPKTALQEWAQSKGLSLPEYEIAGQSGPDHAPVFDVCLSVEGYPPVTAQGRSRQVAEKEAALMMLAQIQKGGA